MSKLLVEKGLESALDNMIQSFGDETPRIVKRVLLGLSLELNEIEQPQHTDKAHTPFVIWELYQLFDGITVCE